ncbi:hypothetical protein HN937_20180 [Candidatus Poribacteria bacterium]|jgi:hypothetical protein|nr:hypothetical protein [Candidatus Poribacteria bacterium]
MKRSTAAIAAGLFVGTVLAAALFSANPATAGNASWPIDWPALIANSTAGAAHAAGDGSDHADVERTWLELRCTRL